MAEALRQAGCNRLAVLTPYVEELNTAIRASLEADGFEIAAIAGLGLRSNLEVGRLPPGAIAEFALAGTPDDAEGVAIACTNFRAFEARELIATRTGRPVVTANASVVDAVRERLALA
jgi:maleate isomerase